MAVSVCLSSSPKWIYCFRCFPALSCSILIRCLSSLPKPNVNLLLPLFPALSATWHATGTNLQDNKRWFLWKLIYLLKRGWLKLRFFLSIFYHNNNHYNINDPMLYDYIGYNFGVRLLRWSKRFWPRNPIKKRSTRNTRSCQAPCTYFLR